ncbi:MAG TPA: hypothetical protein VLH13_03345, partial [Methanomassiliicoccales archaeon]|nr:hypothetical protein [Methanomassiliicoccales archaeon]
ADRVKSLLQYEGFGFTHDTNDIAEGPKESAYKTLETMADKMNAQLHLARIIRAVDERDTAQRIISKHFLPDLIGNLKQFSGQKVRCTKCGESYRRVPLRGFCYCGNKLTLTVYEASVKKYLAVTKRVGMEFGVSQYTQQRVGIIEESIASIFGETGLEARDSAIPSDLDVTEDAYSESSCVEVNGKVTAPTLDTFTTFTMDMVKDSPVIGPEDEKELVIAAASVPHDEPMLQEQPIKKKKCSLDDYF